jgi:penicillin-binding protein 2
MYAFGLGNKLGIDMPSEKSGLIPTPKTYDKMYGEGHWNFCTLLSVSIGQGEVNVTPLQVANEMAYLANKGWFITPHMIDSIDGGDKYGMLDSFKLRHHPLSIPDSVFDAVHDGMQGVMDRGTGAAAKVPGIIVCGKTGTVENYYKGVKQKDHAFFAAFAPRENPQIAIMCVVENSGRFGGTYAAPIVSLMIEKYLKDSITDKARLAKAEWLEKQYLIPAFVYSDFRGQDSIDHRYDTAYLLGKGYIRKLRDTLGIEDIDMEVEQKREEKKPAPLKNETPPINEKQGQPSEIILPNNSTNERKREKPDSTL